jgi:acetoacetyl-CoA reductase
MSSTEHTALVTGGMGGLGQAIARTLHDAGQRVLVTHSPGNERVAACLAAQEQAGYRFARYRRAPP